MMHGPAAGGKSHEIASKLRRDGSEFEASDVLPEADPFAPDNLGEHIQSVVVRGKLHHALALQSAPAEHS